MASSLCEAEWLSVFPAAMPWLVGVFGNSTVEGRLAKHASTHQYSSQGLCDCFNLEWVAHLMLSSTTTPPTNMFIQKRKKAVLSTNPEAAKQSVMVKIKSQTWPSHVLGLKSTVAMPVSFTKHEFSVTLNCLDWPRLGIYTCLQYSR